MSQSICFTSSSNIIFALSLTNPAHYQLTLKMRTSPGCLACKQRHKRCDLVQPVCSGCQRNFLICAWPSGTTSSSSSSSNDNTYRDLQPTTTPPPATALCSKVSPSSFFYSRPGAFPCLILQRKESQYLFSYFIHRTAPAICTRSSGDNPFLRILVPLALQSDMVLQALLAFTGVHCLQWGCETYYRATWEHYAQAIRSLKFGLTEFASSNGSSTALTLAICALLFCFLEVGDFPKVIYMYTYILYTAYADVILRLLEGMLPSAISTVLDTFSFRRVTVFYETAS